MLVSGARATIQGLQRRTDFNGLVVSLDSWSPASGRWEVLTDAGERLAVKPECLSIIASTPRPAASPARSRPSHPVRKPVDGAGHEVWPLVGIVVSIALIRALISLAKVVSFAKEISFSIERRSAACYYNADCFEKEKEKHYVELKSVGFCLLVGFLTILAGSIFPKVEPPNAQVRARAPSYFVRYQWQYGEGPRGGEMRRKVDYEYIPMERQKYVMLPGAPWFRRPFAAYPYFVPEQDAQGRDVCTPYQEEVVHPRSDWKYVSQSVRRTPRPVHVY